MKKIVAIVVTYNRKALLKECIEALLAQRKEKCDVLIIDNNSTDGTKEFIKDFIDNKRVFYFNTGKNIGGAGGFNYGMKKAYELKYDFMWLMDDDCIVEANSLAKLLKADDELEGRYGFLSSRVLWKDGTVCRMNVQKKTFLKKITEQDRKNEKIIMATFVSFFVSTKIVEKVGLPIKDFFIWADDLEYSRRISKKYPCYYVYDSVVTHKTKNNIGSNIAVDLPDNLWRYRFAYRNERFLMNNEGAFGRIYFRLKVMYHKSKILRSDCLDKEERMNIIKEAVKEGKEFRPQIEFVKKGVRK